MTVNKADVMVTLNGDCEQGRCYSDCEQGGQVTRGHVTSRFTINGELHKLTDNNNETC